MPDDPIVTDEFLDAVPRDLLTSLVDAEDCWFDHHGGCQAHGYLSLEPGEKCPQAELKALLEPSGDTVQAPDGRVERLTPSAQVEALVLVGKPYDTRPMGSTGRESDLVDRLRAGGYEIVRLRALTEETPDHA